MMRVRIDLNIPAELLVAALLALAAILGWPQ